MPGRVWEPDNHTTTATACHCIYAWIPQHERDLDPSLPPFRVDVLDPTCPAAEVHARTATITKGHR